MRVDLVAARTIFVEMATMVDPAWKRRAGKIVGDGKAQILHQPKDAIDIVVGIDRGEIVAARVVLEVLPGGFVGGATFGVDTSATFTRSPLKAWLAFDRRIEAFEVDRHRHRLSEALPALPSGRRALPDRL